MRRAAVAVLALAAGAAILAWWRRPAGPANLLLITLDTVRADALGAYGSRTNATPALDRLAASGLRFEQCSTTVPLTLPAHVSLFTGHYPETHGVRTNSYSRLAAGVEGLPEILRTRGYVTGAVIGASVLDRDTGLDRGFVDYDDRLAEAAEGPLPPGAALERSAGEVSRRAGLWLERHRRDRFFLWVHYYDAHDPYEPPEPFAARHPEQPYRGEVEYVDQEVGRLLATLARLGIDRRTLVVAVGDHGEGLGEHDEDTHGYFLYQSTLHVPLILAQPGRLAPGQVVSRPVGIVDLVPTVLAHLGLPPRANAPGRSLLDPGAGDADGEGYAETLYGHVALGLSRLKALRRGSWKYIKSSRPELYDLAADPGERRNLVAESPEVAHGLDRELAALVARSLAVAPAPAEAGAGVSVSEERREQLAALGYLGDAGEAPTAGSELDFSGPSPAERTALIRAMDAAIARLSEGRDAEAEELLRRIAADDPGNFASRQQLGHLAIVGGRLADADRYLGEALALAPDNPSVLEDLAELRLRQGEAEAGLAATRRLLSLRPDLVSATLQQARALGALGRAGEARDVLARARALAPGRAEPDRLLAELERSEGRVAAGLEAARRAVAAEPDSPLSHAVLAELLALAGERDQAVAELERAMALDRSGRYRSALAERLEQLR